ncbi:hypothetical protein BN946_scf184979.g30 [Trametes cinnabarina]|uniref:Alpha/beta hydrolase fold-3 domain-containing protein n=1 Tax=Pycnoporus cinnabarinus TaxID=5643 RepID=A0A060SJ97_PYCCI|nr:hypothetical protein BN946_scf184979.g30 [Trametes cinnabarina]
MAPPLESYEKDAPSIAWVEPVPPELIVDEIHDLAERNGVKPMKVGGFWLGPKGSDGIAGQPAKPDERVIYYFHGGAHVRGSAHPSSAMGAGYEGLLQHLGPNTRIFSLEYRLASAAPFAQENPFPAALLDAIAGYRYLIHTVGFNPRQVIISGDSSGGGLALNLVRYLALYKLPQLPQAGGLLLLSPTMDWGKTYADDPNSAYCRNVRSDFVETVMEVDYTPRALRGNMPEDFVRKSLWISPGSREAEWKPGAFSGLPPTFILAGEAEQTLDGMHAVRDLLLQDIGEERLTYVEMPDTAHDIILFKWFEPERTQSLVKIAEWAQKL